MPVFAFTVGSLGDILATAGLAAEIAKALYDTGAVANECRDLALELQSLQNVLILTQYALQHHHLTPIGETLATFILPEVAQCHSSLQSFMEKLNACRQALLSTVIASFWRRVVWAASSEAASLSAKLSNHRGKLAMLLVSLNCVGFMDFGAEIRQVYARISDVHAYLHQNARSLRHIQDNSIHVVDALGDTIPISTLFCSTWEAFDHIIKGYCKHRIGQRYVEQGDYQLLRAETNELIPRSEFSRVVQAGETLEMSIILRRRLESEDENQRTCPRCSHVNNHSSADGWIRCTRCSGQFQITLQITHLAIKEVDDENSDLDTHDDDDSGSKKSETDNIDDNRQLVRLASEVQFFRRISSYVESTNHYTYLTGANLNSTKRTKELEREGKEKEFANGQHPNYINGVWHCSNCGCPESIAVGRRKGPLGDKSQCGTCGKFWHRHRRPRPVEYNSDPEFHFGLKQKVVEGLKTLTNNDRAISSVATASSDSDTPLAHKLRLKLNGNHQKAPTPPTSAPLKSDATKLVTGTSSTGMESKSGSASVSALTPTAPPASPLKPYPPPWLTSQMRLMQSKYPNDRFEVILRKVSASSTPEWRIKCRDCPGKLYTPGPLETLTNYEVHLKNRQHRHRVNDRLFAVIVGGVVPGGAAEPSSAS